MCEGLDFVDFKPVKSYTQDLIRDFLVNSISLGTSGAAASRF